MNALQTFCDHRDFEIYQVSTAGREWEIALSDCEDANTYDEYVAPVLERYTQLRATQEHSPDRNDMFRDNFNQIVNQDKLTQGMLDAFYGGRDSIFPRLVAYEGGRDKYLERLANVACVTKRSESIYPILDRAFEQFQTPRLKIFDHGCGFFQDVARCFMWSPQVEVTAYDYAIPYRKVITRTFCTHAPQLNFRFADIMRYPLSTFESDAFHVIGSDEVLEHCINPKEVLRELVRMLKPGGIIYLSTFFNSCNGHDPSHLLADEIYQDCDLWFSEVESLGLRKLHYDPRGICKAWQKEM